ncbi:poly [ADP-ribose] polymerase tankyrase-1-like [Coccinella septempunctata]|uniref:poly [ADP-ribose] polymerase tankyrase-1-like n=1 Tax=Coccinella septempunctata TaxID=41139 RepID=UPI001D093F9A|nr:poly [ADP-ribose] polymerase tankyrase-1-like [Coccinella septempunctata]
MPLYDKEADPLHGACINGTLESVEANCYPYITPLGLVTSKLYSFEINYHQESVLVSDYEEKIKFLLKKGANYEEWIKAYGFITNVAEVILREGNKNMFNLMVNYLRDINMQHGISTDTALHIAIERGFYKTTRKILSVNKADVNRRNNEYKETPLHRAVYWHRLKFINLLIEHGGNMKITDAQGRTPLHCACHCVHNKDSKKIIEKCMEYNSLYSRTTHMGYTPMHTLISRSKETTEEAAEVVELFLERGFDLETKDFRGCTPLYLSLKRDVEPMALLLLRHGAHLDITADYAIHFLLPHIVSTKELNEMSRTILKFIALEVSKGAAMHESLGEILRERKDASTYLKMCYQEIEILKSIKIENTFITYWKLLTRSIKQVGMYADNYYIAEAMRTFEISSYPIYGPDIHYKYAKGQRRLELMNACADSLNRMWEWKLPSVFVNMVIDRLTIPDMENIPISEEQQEFRPNRSTVDAIFIVRQLVQKSIEFNKPMSVCFVDFTKAFDRIRLSDVIRSLEKNNIDYKYQRIIKELYRGTRTRIKTKEGLSEVLQINAGIRQGDSLSPTLFNIIIDQIVEDVNRVNAGY